MNQVGIICGPRKPVSCNDLLPCPFCGAPAVVVQNDTYSGCQVGCSVDCEASPYICRPLGQHEEAKRVWNTRAGRDALCLKCAEKCAGALKVIHTWATFEDGRALDPEHVANLCNKTLYP